MASSNVTLRRNSACDSIQYTHRLVTDTMVAIISCWRRSNGKSGDISAPNVANAWYSASGIRLCEATIWDAPPSGEGCTGVAYSFGYKALCASIACFKRSSASETGTVLIQVIERLA